MQLLVGSAFPLSLLGAPAFLARSVSFAAPVKGTPWILRSFSHVSFSSWIAFLQSPLLSIFLPMVGPGGIRTETQSVRNISGFRA